VAKALTSEQWRILVAAAEGRLRIDPDTARYKIDGEDPPDRRERERLQKRGLLTRARSNEPMFTQKGLDALRSAPVIEPPLLGGCRIAPRDVDAALEGAPAIVSQGEVENLKAAVTRLQATMFLTGSPPKSQDEALADLAALVDHLGEGLQ